MHGPPGFPSGRLLQLARAEVHRIGRALVKGLVRAAGVVKAEVRAQRLVDLLGRLMGMQIDLLIFHASPQPLDKHVVDPAALAIHADANGIVLEHLSERIGGKLAALIGVEDLGTTKARERLLERASTQNSLASVLEVRHASTLRL